MDLYTFGQCLSNITKDEIYITSHFRERIGTRFGEEFINNVYHTILNCTPVGILEQDMGKFKVFYRHSEMYDLIILMGVKDSSTTRLSLITCFQEAASKRVRFDEKTRN